MLIHRWDGAGHGEALAFVRAQRFGTRIAAGRGRDVPVGSLAGDWSYVPAAWKAIGGEDPALGIPTTYHAAVQLICSATVLDDPEVHRRRLSRIRGLRLAVRELRGKVTYAGSVDLEHRLAVAGRLAERDGPGDRAAREHLLRSVDSR